MEDAVEYDKTADSAQSLKFYSVSEFACQMKLDEVIYICDTSGKHTKLNPDTWILIPLLPKMNVDKFPFLGPVYLPQLCVLAAASHFILKPEAPMRII